MKGPQFLRFFRPLVDALNDLGGSATSAEALDAVIEKCGITDEDLQETLHLKILKLEKRKNFLFIFYILKMVSVIITFHTQKKRCLIFQECFH